MAYRRMDMKLTAAVALVLFGVFITVATAIANNATEVGVKAINSALPSSYDILSQVKQSFQNLALLGASATVIGIAIFALWLRQTFEEL